MHVSHSIFVFTHVPDDPSVGQNGLVGHGEFRLLQGNFIPVVAEGLPVAFVASSFSEWLKFVTENPAGAKSVSIIELYHPDKWSSVPSDATAYFHRRPVSCLCQQIYHVF